MAQKVISGLIIISLFSIKAGAQKPVIDMAAFNHWERASSAKLTPKGNYVYFTITDSGNHDHSFIKSTDSKWEREITGDYKFTMDDKQVVLLIHGSLLMGTVR